VPKWIEQTPREDGSFGFPSWDGWWLFVGEDGHRHFHEVRMTERGPKSGNGLGVKEAGPGESWWPANILGLDATAGPAPREWTDLRDRFAMHAMAALIQKLAAWEDPDSDEDAGSVPGPLQEWLGTHGGDQDEIASNAYEIADAMLRAREKPPVPVDRDALAFPEEFARRVGEVLEGHT
jgi:hypothetical protein